MDKRIEHMLTTHIPAIDFNRATLILAQTRRTEDVLHHSDVALRIARQAGVEEQVVHASEVARRAIWQVIWDSSWSDAWTLSWVAARAAIGYSVADLARTDSQHTYELTRPWAYGFMDMPFPGGAP